MDFAEYTALARHLSELRRAREQRAGHATAYRAATETGIAQLGQRLASQHQRLAELARTFGEPGPRGGPPPPVPPTPPAGHPGYPGSAGSPPGQHPGYPGAVPPHPGQPPLPGAVPVAGLASQTGEVHPGGGLAYPELPAGPARLALPATPVSGPGPRPVPAPTSGAGSWPPPAPRRPADGSPAMPPAGPVPSTAPATGPVPPAVPDPGRELDLARRAADAADQEAMRAESLAGQPPLLPTWSPLARAVAVYLGCAVLMVLVHFTVMGQVLQDQMDSFTFVAWTFAGLPAAAFFGGFLVLNIWGKPRVGTVPPRFPRLGFLICFVGTPIGYCLSSLGPG